MSEITVKYFKSKDSGKTDVIANISGRKNLIFPKNNPTKL